MNNIFFELIRVALGQQKALSYEPSTTEWAELFMMARKQAVVGVMFFAIKRLPETQTIYLPNKLMIEWLTMATQIQTRNEKANRRCMELQQMFASKGMRSCILKGQGVAALYQKRLQSLRQTGDIDAWVDASREKVIDYVMGIAPTRGVDEKHIHFKNFDDVEVEAHWIPVNRNSPKFNRILGDYFKKESERQFANQIGKACFPTIDFQLVHQLLHIYGHYVYEGVGLRQLMDLYFTQKAFVESIPEKKEEVLMLFKRLGLMKFVAGTQYVLHEVFAMEIDYLIYSPDEKEGRLLLKEIETGGNFGQYDVRNNVKDESFFHRALRRFECRWHMVRFDPLGTILMPFNRARLEVWMRTVRRKYRV